MPDWMANHAAFVAPFAVLLLKHNCDSYALGRSKDDLLLLADATRETGAVLRAVGRRIVPRAHTFLFGLPRFVLAGLFRLFLATRFAEIGGAWHCSQAPDEMNQLARELKELVQRSNLPVPALRKILEAV